MYTAARPLLLLALLLVAPAAAGQGDMAATAGPPVTILEDPSGDVRAVVQGQEQTLDGSVRPSVDFTAIDIGESPLNLEFRLRIASFEDLGHEAENGRAYRLQFDHGDRSYYVEMANAEGVRGFYLRADLYSRQGTTVGWIEQVDAERLDANNAFVLRVPRELIPTGLGAPPSLGTVLTNISAYSSVVASLRHPIYAEGVEIGPFWAGDDIPDSGVGAYAVRLGLGQTGHIHLTSDEPFRSSNGEASTFIFSVRAANRGMENDQFAIKVVGAPSGWDVRGPSERITIPASETIEFPVTVRTQFAHEHGAARSFVLELHSLTDPGAVGRVELGIRYPAVPQPAGHHSTLVFHSWDSAEDDAFAGVFAQAFGLVFVGADLSKAAFMNTDAEAGNDDHIPVDGGRCAAGLGGTVIVNVTYCWRIRLSPALELGLDFDMNALGTIQVPIGALVPSQGAHVEGYIRVRAPPAGEFEFDRAATTVAWIQPVGDVPIGPAGDVRLEGVVVPAPGGDYVPYLKGSDLELLLNVTLDRPDNFYLGPGDAPKLLPGGWMDLPLVEYEDRVQQTFGAGGLLRLTADSAQQRLANPGSTAVYNITIHNDGPVEDAFRLDVAGSHADWASIMTGDAVTVGAGSKQRIVVAVQVPGDALDGERSDLILQAMSASDANQRALLRLVTTVDIDATHRDDLGLAQVDGKDSPLAPLGILLVGLLAVARRRA